ncbi:MAG: hypothetical protein CMJ78_06625 [Planctomycetaceae bacterium]|nr:hypothetical protein [Planctomycetaceae bacterium]
MFAKEFHQYLHTKRNPSPVGQAIVKESWHATKVDGHVNVDEVEFTDHPSGRQVSMFATHGKQEYKATEQRELFIMFKTDSTTPGSDAGWVYGVTSADGKKVVAAGHLENCMSCQSS